MPTNDKGLYDSVDDLPPQVKQALADLPHALKTWMDAYNAAAQDPKYQGSDTTPFQVAWAAVQDRYEKDDQGNWQEKPGWKPKDGSTTAHRDFSADQRKQLAKEGKAMPDGSYPIETAADVEAAVNAYNMSTDKKPEDKAFIIKRARELDATEKLPDSWNVTSHADPEPTGVVTLPNVELVKAGNWASMASGRVPITGDDLDAMVTAATDAEVDGAPVKIGHTDPRFDGEPALGWIRNVRRVGDSILADLADVPAKLADVVRHAYPRRSVEIAWGVKTPSGKAYKAALAGVALLGVTPPAVKGLADVLTRYSGPTNEATDHGAVTLIDGDDSEVAGARAKAMSAISTFAAHLDGDPAQYRAIASLSLLAADSGDLPPEPPHTSFNAKPPTPNLEGAVNDDEVRAALGLGADVPITDQLRGAAEALKAKADADAQAKAKADAEEAARKAAADAAANGAAGALTTVDKGALEKLMADSAKGAEAMRILGEQERDKELAAALSAGKIAPASVDVYKSMWESVGADQVKALLAGLPQVYSTTTKFSASPTTVPAPGSQDDPDNLGFPDDKWDDFMKTINLGSK